MAWWNLTVPPEHQQGYQWWRNAVITGTQPVCPPEYHDSVRWVCQQVSSQRVPEVPNDIIHLLKAREFRLCLRIMDADISVNRIKTLFASGWLPSELFWYHGCYDDDFVIEHDQPHKVLDAIVINHAPIAIALAMGHGLIEWLEQYAELVTLAPMYRRCYIHGTMARQLAVLKKFPVPINAVGDILSSMAADTVTPISQLGDDIWYLMVASLWRTRSRVTRWSDFQIDHFPLPEIAQFLINGGPNYKGDPKLIDYIAGNTMWYIDEIKGFDLSGTWFGTDWHNLPVCIWQYGALSTSKRNHITNLIIKDRVWGMIIDAIGYSRWRRSSKLMPAIVAAMADGYGPELRKILGVIPIIPSNTYRKVAAMLGVSVPPIEYTQPPARTRFISAGGYGSVDKAVDQWGGTYAIKSQEEIINGTIEVMIMRTRTDSVDSDEYMCPLKHAFFEDYEIKTVMPFYQRNLDGYQCQDMGEWITLGYRLLMALDQLHSKGIAHCDFKSANILMNTVNDAVLTDFGGCVLVVPGVSNTAWTTYPYEAPEIYNDEPFDMSIDIWAWAVVMLHACMGTKPFYHPDIDRNISNMVQLGIAGNPTTAKIPNYITKLAAMPQWSLCLEVILEVLKTNPLARPTARQLLHHKIFHPMHDEHTPPYLGDGGKGTFEYYKNEIRAYWQPRVYKPSLTPEVTRLVDEVMKESLYYTGVEEQIIKQQLYAWSHYCLSKGYSIHKNVVIRLVSIVCVMLGLFNPVDIEGNFIPPLLQSPMLVSEAYLAAI